MKIPRVIGLTLIMLSLSVTGLKPQEPSDTVMIQDTLPPITLQDTLPPVEVPDTQWVRNDTLFVQMEAYQDTTRLPPMQDTIPVPIIVQQPPDTVHIDSLDAPVYPEPEPEDPVDPVDPIDPTPGEFSGPAELPRRYVEVDRSPPSDTIPVTDLQETLNAAECGTAYALGDHVGNFRYFKDCAGNPVWLIGGSITSADRMPLNLGDAIGLRVVGTRVEAAAGDNLENTLINLDGGHDIQLINVTAYGHPELDLRRCVRANGDSLAIVDSELLGCKAQGADAQAVIVWNSRGPLLIQNSVLEGSGENFMAGGADSESAETNPQDITIRGNHFIKPPEWFNTRWTIKNLIEMKNGSRVLIEDNIFENSWTDAQGTAILFKSVNQGGGEKGSWSKSTDIIFRNNIIRNVASVYNLAAAPQGPVAEPLSRVHIVNNLAENTGNESPYHQSGDRHRAWMLLAELKDITIENNTTLGDFANQMIMEGGGKENLVFRNNVTDRTSYGVRREWLESNVLNGSYEWSNNVWGPASSGWRSYPAGDCAGVDPLLPVPEACAGAGANLD